MVEGCEAREEAQDEGPLDEDAFAPMEVDVSYNALGRKFVDEPFKLALNLSREGADSALFVAPGQDCYFPKLAPDRLFHVKTVKPWSAYIELVTVDGKPHKFTAQELRSGGAVRVRIALCLFEECAMGAMRLQRARPKAGLKLSTLLEVMNAEFALQVEPPAAGELPPWLEHSSLFTSSYSELREDWLIKCLAGPTPLERTMAVLVSPQKRRGVEGADVLLIEELLEKLAEASPQLAVPPFGDDTLLRRWLDASPHFDLTGDEITVVPADGEESWLHDTTVAAAPDPKPHTAAPTTEMKTPRWGELEQKPKPNEAPLTRAERVEARGPLREIHDVATEPLRGGHRDRRYGRAMKVLDELGRLNSEALKLSRDKRQISEDCHDGGEEVGPLATQLLEVLDLAPDTGRRLSDEVKMAMHDGAIDASQARAWQNAISAYGLQMRALVQLLEQPEGVNESELIPRLTTARHGLRDFQREVLDEVMVALSGAGEDGREAFGEETTRYGPTDNSLASQLGHSGRRARNFPIKDLPVRRNRGIREVHCAQDSRDDFARSDSAESRSSSLPACENMDIKLNAPDLYEVKSSEGPWYPATIRRLRRNGRYEADLYGGGCSVYYPSVKLREIRFRHRANARGGGYRQSRDRGLRDNRGVNDSRSRNGRSHDVHSRGCSRGRYMKVARRGRR